MPKPQQPPEHPLFGDPQGSFNALLRITSFGASLVRPLFLSGQGSRAYGLETLFAFCALPVFAAFTRSGAVRLYWYLWCLMLIIRKLTPDRSQHTGFWGNNRLLDWLTLGLLGEVARRFIEPVAIACLGWLAARHSVPLSRVLYFGAFCMAIQYRIGFELLKREREAIHDATVTAGRYR